MRAALLNTLHYELISHFITLYELLDTVGVVLFVRYSMACDGLLCPQGPYHQPISDGEATDRCKSVRRKMADCPS